MKFDVIGTSVRPFKDMWTPALRKKFLQWSTTHEHIIRRLPLLSPSSRPSPAAGSSRANVTGAGQGAPGAGYGRQAAVVRPVMSRQAVTAHGMGQQG